MRVDLLFRSAGLDEVNPDPITAEQIREALLLEAETFFRAGGVLTLADWAQLGGASRAAFVAARGGPPAEAAAPRRDPVAQLLEDAVDQVVKEVAA